MLFKCLNNIQIIFLLSCARLLLIYLTENVRYVFLASYQPLAFIFFPLEIKSPCEREGRDAWRETASEWSREREFKEADLIRYAIDLLVWVHSKSLTLELNSWRLHHEKQMWIRSTPITLFSPSLSLYFSHPCEDSDIDFQERIHFMLWSM